LRTGRGNSRVCRSRPKHPPFGTLLPPLHTGGTTAFEYRENCKDVAQIRSCGRVSVKISSQFCTAENLECLGVYLRFSRSPSRHRRLTLMLWFFSSASLLIQLRGAMVKKSKTMISEARAPPPPPAPPSPTKAEKDECIQRVQLKQTRISSSARLPASIFIPSLFVFSASFPFREAWSFPVIGSSTPWS